MLALASSLADGKNCRVPVPGPRLRLRSLEEALGRRDRRSAAGSFLAVVAGAVVRRGLGKVACDCGPVAAGLLHVQRMRSDRVDLLCDRRDGKARCASALELPPQKKQSREAVKRAALQKLRDHAASKGGRCTSAEYTNRRTKVQWECKCGHEWKATPHNVLNQGSWCPRCAIGKRSLSLYQLHEHAMRRGGRCLSDTYRNSHTKVRWQCKLGHTWEATAAHVLNHGTWCPECARRTTSPSKRTLRDLQEHAAARGGKCLAAEYVGMSVKVLWQCEKSHIWSASASSVLNHKTWCPVCAKKAPLGLERLQSHAARLGGQCLAEDYTNAHTKVRWKCGSGHVWPATPDSVMNSGSWCPECQKIGLARLQEHAASLGGRCLSKSYSNQAVKILWECQLGHRWKASAASILHKKTWCPQCAASSWKTEAEVRSILEAIFDPARFESCYPEFLGGLQLDGYCSELSLAFEYQGEQHFDPDNYFHFGDPSRFESQIERDVRKRQLCEETGVRLVLVPHFANDKRVFVRTALLQWYSIAEITALMLPARA
ncbi:unnamed protein product [Symbiodinium natans]|uniref:Zinc-ribbon domain-containing protein n=1 Tax=Symbiodinium natans TaxID=878477 RepID=A0A812JS16_9DINO|nr:unnamed protein product [Symbiodinium natans]